MKKLLILLTALALTAGTASAQTDKRGPRANNGQTQPAPSPEQQVDRLTKKLGLSADQREQLLKVEQARRSEISPLRSGQQSGSSAQATKHQSAQTRHEQYELQIQAIFTADQYAQYVQMRDSQSERTGKRNAKS